MGSYEKWLEGCRESQEEFCKKKIGVRFGLYETINAWFDENVSQQMVTVRCVQCGEETTVSGRIWRDWMRGKGRHQDKCKNCEKIKKEQLQLQRQEVAEQKRIEKEKAAEEKRRKAIKYATPEYIGKRYGHLTILEYSSGNWKCKCDCGFEKWIKCTPIVMGKTSTCGRLECKYHCERQIETGNGGNIVMLRGEKFERDCAKFLEDNQYETIKTQRSGDYGIDLLVKGKDGSKCGFQLKQNFSTKSAVGIKAVMEAFAGGTYYDCDKFFVVSTTGYTVQARKMAKKLNVILLNENFQIDNNNFLADKNSINYVTINGITKSKSAWCDEYHTAWDSVKKRMETFDMTFEEAVKSKEWAENAKVYEINGKKHSLAFWCEQYQQLVPTVTYRLKQGMDIETALMMPGRLNGLKAFPDSRAFV